MAVIPMVGSDWLGKVSTSIAKQRTETNMSAKTEKVVIHETFTADYRNQIHFAKRSDGQWFMRGQDKTPWGYRWSAWKETAFAPDRGGVSCYPKFARIPKA